MFVLELFEFNKMAERMSDIVTARELIGTVKLDPKKNYKYFDFLKYLRNKHSLKYSEKIHKEASKLSR